MPNNFVGYTGKPGGHSPWRGTTEQEARARNAVTAARHASQDGRLHPRAAAVDDALAALADAVAAYQDQCEVERRGLPLPLDGAGIARAQFLAGSAKNIISALCAHPVLAKLLTKNATAAPLASLHPVSETPAASAVEPVAPSAIRPRIAKR